MVLRQEDLDFEAILSQGCVAGERQRDREREIGLGKARRMGQNTNTEQRLHTLSATPDAYNRSSVRL